MRNPFARNPGAASAAVGAAAGGEGGGGGFSFPEWREAFADVSLPVFLDVGSARGAFVEAMAKHFPQRNYLGEAISEWPFGTPLAPEVRVRTFQLEGLMGEPLLNADGKPPGGLAWGSFGLSRASLLNHFEPQTASLSVRLGSCVALTPT